MAEAKVAFGYRETAMQEVRMRDARTRVLAVTEIAASPEALAIRHRLREEVCASAVLGAQEICPALDPVKRSKRTPT